MSDTSTATRICIYCGRNGSLSREHVFPDWMNDVLATKTDVSFDMIEQNLVKDGVHRETRKSRGHVRQKIVCESCNNGWLSRIDNDSKKIVSALIKDEKNQIIGLSEATLVTSLSAKMAINSDFMVPNDSAISEACRTAFYANRTPSDFWHIWIGRHKGAKFSRTIDRFSLRISDDPETVYPIRKNTASFLFGLDRLFVYAFYGKWQSFASHIDRLVDDNCLIKIFPFDGVDRRWSDIEPASDEQLESLRFFLGEIARKNTRGKELPRSHTLAVGAVENGLTISNGVPLKGEDFDNLHCGSCSAVLTEGLSVASLRKRYEVQDISIRCAVCGSGNLVPGSRKN